MKKYIILIILSLHQFSYSQNEIPEIIREKITVKTAKSFSIFKKIEKINNYNLITVDFIIIEAYQSDGLDSLDVTNNNPKLRTYIISDKLLNKHKEMLQDCDFCYWEIKVSDGKVDEIKPLIQS